jgi:tetratricopeptide (TPR) repeat protein
MTRRIAGRFLPVLGACLVAGLAAGLYWPFLGNPRVFDDWVFFSGSGFSYYATHPFGLGLRIPPFFTLAITEVLIGSAEAHRIVSLAVHVACSLALYKLIFDLMRVALPTGRAGESVAGAQSNAAPMNARAAAFIGAAVFAIHPVAVYAAGYLVQRTIVFATLFSLLSVVLFVRGLTRGSHADAISAALMYSIAVLSKEHSVLLPVAAVLTVLLVKPERRFALRHGAIYLSVCAPAAISAVLFRMWLIGEAYEPGFGTIADEVESIFGHSIKEFPWALSAVTQAGLFFRYVLLWLWPDTGAMSIDLRVHFFETLSAGWILLKVAAFAAFGALGFLLLLRRGRTGVAGLGLLWVWILFMVELSSARFQEPFVLYRSYLWAPGILIAISALLSALSRRAALAVFAVAIPILFYQAHDRLATFSNLLVLWKDAVEKLPAKPIPWGSRTLFNLVREYARHGQPDKALEVTDRCLAQYPDTFYCVSARGLLHLQYGEFERGLPYLARATELRPNDGFAHHRLGALLERMGRIDEAKTRFRRASELGYWGADLELSRLGSPGSGLSPPIGKDPDSR